MPTDNDNSCHSRKLCFERHPTQIAYDASTDAFVVRWSKKNGSKVEPDISKWRPSIGAVTTLYDRGKVESGQVLAAAKAIGCAWDLGDREYLDSEGCKKAAETIRDMSNVEKGDVKFNEKDMKLLIRRLLDEMAAVRFMYEPQRNFSKEAMIPMVKAIDRCYNTPGFADWPAISRRRKFLLCLKKRECTGVVYTIAALLFDTGACPLLSSMDRRTVRVMAMEKSNIQNDNGRDAMVEFVEYSMTKIREAKAAGECRIMGSLTQQQFSDTITSQHSC